MVKCYDKNIKNKTSKNEETELSLNKEKTNNALSEIEKYKNILSSSLKEKTKFNLSSLMRDFEFENFHFNIPLNLKEERHKLKKEIKELSNSKGLEKLLDSLNIKHKNKLNIANKKLDLVENNIKKEKEKQLKTYKVNKALAKEKINKHNNKINNLKLGYESYNKNSIKMYFSLALKEHNYSFKYKKNFKVDFDNNEKILFIDFKILTIDEIPSIIEYKYVKSKKETVPRKMNKNALKTFYNNVKAQIVLELLNYIFSCDYKNTVSHINLTLFTSSSDSEKIVDEIFISKSEFKKINLNKLTDKDLVSIVNNLKKNSKNKTITKGNSQKNLKNKSKIIDKKINLATLEWEAFEDLIGKLFSKEFSDENSKVEVTKRSRDGGADVIITSTDPIRGGKYIVQVKRYNKTVSPTAVRDLYGTIQHEGALKGILVTTSDFGKSSFEFIENKPITLINGSMLLSLLKNYGYNNYKIELS